MSLHQDATRRLTDWTAPDPAQDALRRLYLDHLGARPDAMRRSCGPDHLTASAIVFDTGHRRVALTLHARLGRWLQTGGHCEETDATLAAAALREATEESGLTGLRVDPVPVLLSRHEVPCGELRPAHHLDVQFVAVAVADSGDQLVLSDESTDLAWFAVDGLPDETDDSVRALVSAGARRLRGSP